MSAWLLSAMVFAPVVGAVGVLLAPSAIVMKRMALFATSAALALSVVAVAIAVAGDAPGATMPIQFSIPWITAGEFRVNFALGIDGLSAPFILLTTVISLLAIGASWNFETWQTRHGLKGYLALMLLLETGILGVFAATDFFLFYVFFEIMLVPMYFLIGIWGGVRREYAAIKFFIYTLIGSVLLLIVMLAVYFYAPAGARTFDFATLAHDPQIQAALRDPAARFLGYALAPALFLITFVAFAIKLPVVPLHTWLPDAHVEAPSPVSMILAALLLKTGGYGLIRIGYSIFPSAAHGLSVFVAIVGVVSILYGAFCTLAQRDLKRLVAYSSVSHMGYVLLGLAAFTPLAISGAIFQMIGHGVSSAMCFYLVGVIEKRTGHRDIDRLGGLWLSLPRFSSFAAIGFFATMGLPALCGFIGEVLVILGTFESRSGALAGAAIPLGLLAASATILAAAYILWMMQRVFLGTRRGDSTPLSDLDRRETSILVPLAVLAFLLGCLPQQTVLHFLGSAVTSLLRLGA